MSSDFKYLGSIIQKDGEIDSDVNHKIQASSWNGGAQQEFYVIVTFRYGWRESFIRLLLGQFVIWHKMLGCKRYHAQKMSVAKMRMLRWMYGNTRRDKVSNEDIRTKIGVASIQEKMKENRLW